MTADADRRFELAVGRVLRLGIVVSSCCLAAALAMAYGGGPTLLTLALFDVGLVTLFATPGARLVVAAAIYARQREWLFVGLALIVAAELVASVFAAR